MQEPRRSRWTRRWVVVPIVVFLIVVWGIDGDVWAWPQGAEDPLARHFDAAQASLRNGDQESAAVEYKAFLGEALHRVANARAHAGDLAAAETTYREALSFAGADSGLRLDYASVLFDQGRIEDAGPVVQAVVNSDPDNSGARMLLGRILLEKMDYSAAKEQLEKAATGGDFKEVWHQLGITYLRLQQLDRARLLLRKVIVELGDTPRNRVAVATTYYYGDYPDQAIAELQKAIAQNGAEPDAHYFLGLSYLAHNEAAGYEKALSEFRVQLRIEPDDFRGHYMLGYIALQKRNFDEAEKELRRAAALNPADEGTQLSLGQLYSDTERRPQAEKVLRRLIASHGAAPDFSVIRAHYILGRILQQSDRTDEGAAEIRTSEQLRKQLRLSLAEVAGHRERGTEATTGAGKDEVSKHAGAPATAAEQETARAFVRQLSPLIGEAYYNLGGISVRHRDPAAAEEYFRKATEWDPSLRAQRP